MKKRLIALLLSLIMLLTCMGAAEGILSPESRKVGDTICIKQGTDVYQSIPGDEDQVGWPVTADVTATITEITKDDDGNDAWYKFTSTDGTDANVFCYVSASEVESVKATEESEEPTVSPSSEPTAEPTAEPTESPEPSANPDESETGEEGTEAETTETEKDTFSVGTNGIQISAAADKGVFPEGTSISATTDDSDYSDCFSGNVLGIVAVNISFWNAGEEVQPQDGYVSVTMSIPAGLVPDDAETFTIYHIGATGPEEVQEYDLSAYRSGIDAYGGTAAATGGETSSDEGFSIDTASVGVKSFTAPAGEQPLNVTFAAKSFSSFVVVFNGGKYPAQLLSEALEKDKTYSITTIPATLIDYDPELMNKALTDDAKEHKYNGSANAFLFNGYSNVNPDEGRSGVNSSSQYYAKQGIVKDTLGSDGLPQFNYVSSNTANILFGSQSVSGKTVYPVNFQMIYNKDTGYYTYKSSANHAQLNEDKDTVELYTDTLAVASIVRKNLSLQVNANDKNWGANHAETITNIETCYKGKAEDNNGRTDPYVYFRVDGENGIPTSQVKQIYVKMKVDPSVVSNTFQLYYDGTNKDFGVSEARSKLLKYEVSQDKNEIEFFIDTNDLGGWNEAGNVKKIRIDPFDSDTDHGGSGSSLAGKWFEIEQISLLGSDPNGTSQKDGDGVIWTKAGFYPFSKIEDSYPGVKASKFNEDKWAEKIKDDGNSTSLSTRSILKPGETTDGNTFKKYIDQELCFALVTEFQFYIPEGQKDNKDHLTYYFNGDDDLWVFVDGQLVLDIGGGHGSIEGTIDFTDGKSTVKGAVTVTGYNSTDSTIGQKVENKLDSSLTSSGLHTMKIFYMERCGSVSNCYMKYNLPVVPTGNVVVSKTVDKGNSTVADNDLDDKAFSFTITGKYNGGSTETTSTSNTEDKKDPTKGTLSWTIATNGKQDAITESRDITNGTFERTFTLKNGQTAAFSGIPENYDITVTENTTTGNLNTSTHKYIKTKVNDVENSTATGTTSKNGKLNFAFTNTYELQLTDLTIKKEGWQDIDENQSFIFKVTGEGLGTNGVNVVIKGNGSATIKDLRIGETYTVTEVTDWSWRYTPKENGKTIKLSADKSNNTVTIKNNRSKDKWLDGNAYCRNIFGKSATTTTK